MDSQQVRVAARADVERAEADSVAIAEHAAVRAEGAAESVAAKELAGAKAQAGLEQIERLLRKEVWVLNHVIHTTRRVNLLIMTAIATIPVLCTAMLHVFVVLEKAEVRADVSTSRTASVRHAVTGMFLAVHVALVSVNGILKLPDKITDAERMLKVSNKALQDVNFAQHKPADAIPALLNEVEKHLAFGKGNATHHPPEWVSNLYDKKFGKGGK